MFDIEGRLIFNQKFNTSLSNFQLPITENIISGIYLYTVIKHNNIIAEGRLIKNYRKTLDHKKTAT